MEEHSPNQTSLPIQPEPVHQDVEHDRLISERLMFATDEQLAAWLAAAESRSDAIERELQRIDNYCRDQAAKAPSMVRACEELRRELAAVRQNIGVVRDQLEPRSRSTDGLKPAA